VRDLLICAAGKAGGLARDIAQVWGLWASGTAADDSHGLQPGCELLAEPTAAGPGSPVGAGTKGIQHLPDELDELMATLEPLATLLLAAQD
jgi:hypothetical protein